MVIQIRPPTDIVIGDRELGACSGNSTRAKPLLDAMIEPLVGRIEQRLAVDVKCILDHAEVNLAPKRSREVHRLEIRIAEIRMIIIKRHLHP